MLTVQDFVSQYSNLSNAELYQIHLDAHQYSDEAQEALAIVVQHRGGLEVLVKENEQENFQFQERLRIKQEVKKLAGANSSLDFLKKVIASTHLPTNEVASLIEKTYAEVSLNQEDKRIKPRTVLGSIIGGTIASVVGGGLWGLLMVQTHRIFYFFIAGLAVLSYGLIRVFTKQSKENLVVFISTIVSVAGALLIGQLIFDYFG